MDEEKNLLQTKYEELDKMKTKGLKDNKAKMKDITDQLKSCREEIKKYVEENTKLKEELKVLKEIEKTKKSLTNRAKEVIQEEVTIEYVPDISDEEAANLYVKNITGTRAKQQQQK